MVVLADQLSKSWAVAHLRDRVVHVVWTLQFNLGFNSGMAFSQGTGLTTIITVVAVPLVVGLCWWASRMTRRVMAVATALIIGGAAGNLADRLFRDHGGAVVDFIDFRWWPVFNLADAALSVGSVVLLVASFREPADDPVDPIRSAGPS